MDGLIDTQAAARLLGVSKSLLDHDRLQPALGVPYIKLGAAVRYDPQALLAWARAKTVNPPEPATAAEPQSPEARVQPPRRRGRPREGV